MVRNTTLSAACLVAVLSFAATCQADEFHYNNILVGDRASGMGGAYTAVSDDASGMYYNPAGLAYSAGKNLSASVNAYNVSKRTYKGVFNGQDWTRESSYLLPNFFGIIQPIGRLKVGFSYAVPDSNQEDQDQSFHVTGLGGAATQVINFNNKNDTNLFGPSAALQLSDTLAVGATLYAHKRNTEAILNSTAISNDNPATQFQWNNQHVESDEWGVRPILGIMWAPVEKVSLGLAVAKTWILSSEVLAQNTSTAITGGGATFALANPGMTTSGDKRKYPYQVSAGVAFFPNSSLLVSGDVTYFTSYDYTFLGATVKRDAVVNGAIGVEYYLTKQWALRGGAFTDFANTPELSATGTNQSEHVDQFGGSLSLSHFTRNTSISAGGSFKYGTGQAQVLGSGPLNDTTASSWTAFISSSYSY